MANQIGDFFGPYPEVDAVAGIRDHLTKFWDPSMRHELLALARAQAQHTGARTASDDAQLLGARVLQAVVMPPLA